MYKKTLNQQLHTSVYLSSLNYFVHFCFTFKPNLIVWNEGNSEFDRNSEPDRAACSNFGRGFSPAGIS